MSARDSLWLRLQLALGVGGAATWYVGASVGSDFVAGVGVGLLAAALALGVLRRLA